MKKGVIKVAAVMMSGIVSFHFPLSTISQAMMIANEQPLAGINISLDKYVENVVSEGAIVSTEENQGTGAEEASLEVGNEETQGTEETAPTGEVAGAGETPQTQEEPSNKEEAQEDKEKPKKDQTEKHVTLNLVYDRLGIAKVDTYLNVRKRPSENAKIIGKMIKNSGCHIYKIKNGWAKIVSGKVNGYVKSEFLVTDKKAEQMATEVGTIMATVNTPALKVRALPTTDATMYSMIALEEDFDVVKENLTKNWMENFIRKHTSKKELKNVNRNAMMDDLDNWICIRVDNDKAFVAKEYVKIAYKLERAVLVNDLATDGSDGVSSVRARLVQYAKQFLGNRYVYGGTSLTNGTDCSGFSMGVFRNFGYHLPRTSGAQAAATRSISSSEAQPGDLFFYSNGSRVNHVAIYIGSGMVIHASNPRTGIKISNAYYRSPAKIGRVIHN